MKKIIFILLLIYPFLGYSQHIGGTLIIAGIASDGIVVAVDSRGSFKDKNNETIAYIDSMCKLTLLNKFPVAMANSSTIGREFITSVIAKYNTNNTNNSLQKTVFSFSKSLLNRGDTLNTVFAIAGYEGNIPSIYSIKNKNIHTTHSGYVSSSSNVDNYFKGIHISTLTCEVIAKIFEKTIYQYAKDNHYENKIGGPISIVIILPDGNIKWIKNNFTYKDPIDYIDFYKTLKSGNRKIYPVIKDGDKMAIELMELKN